MVSRPVDVAEVRIWGQQVGAVLWDDDQQIGSFEYTPEFRDSGMPLAPLTMPLGPGVFRFPELERASYHGLPGMLADSLPDQWGNELIDMWLAQTGRSRDSFSSVERLCYVGSRGMGALEYRPALHKRGRTAVSVDVDRLADLAADVLASRTTVAVELSDDGLDELLRIGTSAGGARAKALVAWNRETGEIRSGQAELPNGFSHWILKFDGVGSSNRDLKDPQGYGRVEYAYHHMAAAAGVALPEAHLHVDGAGRAHFLTRRFDRTAAGEKIHTQTLAAVAHYDFNRSGAYSYEDAMSVLLRLEAPLSDVEEQYRRMVFNIVARNQDDHTKNITYIMSKQGRWRLGPAYDVIWAYNPSGEWTSHHQMTVAGKRDEFRRRDLEDVSRVFGLRDPGRIIDQVLEAAANWPTYASAAEVPDTLHSRIQKSLRLDLT